MPQRVYMGHGYYQHDIPYSKTNGKDHWITCHCGLRFASPNVREADRAMQLHLRVVREKHAKSN